MSKFLSMDVASADTELARNTPLNPGLDATPRATAGEAPASSALSFALHAAASLVALGLFCIAATVWAARLG